MTPVRRRLASLGRLAALALAVGACGPAGTGASAEPVATSTVDLPPSYRYEPASIVVAAGTTVTWTNSDHFTHSIQLDGEAAPGLVAKPGESVTHTFDAPGTFAYVCTFHPQDMRGTVEVTAAPGTEP